MLNGSAITFSRTSSFLCSITTKTSPIFSMIIPPLIQLETVNCLGSNNIDFIDDWPANSPDLNPVEHVWDCLDRQLRRHPIPPANVNDLRKAFRNGTIFHRQKSTLQSILCAGDALQWSIQEVVIPVIKCVGFFLKPLPHLVKIPLSIC